jgi:molybdopterin converting factor subunit 1
LRVTVLLFARAREIVGTGQRQLELPPGADAAAAFQLLAESSPGLASMLPVIRCAVDGEYASWETMLREGSELALIPPTAGG